MNSINNNNFNKSKLVKTESFGTDEHLLVTAKLDQQLGPEFVSTRPGAGGLRVSYIEGWKLINIANSVFGFNGWFSEVKTIQVDFLDEKSGKFSVGLSIVVRVTLKDGSFHEDIGYGSCDNVRTKAMAFEKAKKEAMTDGMKRALRCFGNAMGNCLYDKEFLSKISGVKCAPPDFDETNLMRLGDSISRTGTSHPQTSIQQQQQQPQQQRQEHPAQQSLQQQSPLQITAQQGPASGHKAPVQQQVPQQSPAASKASNIPEKRTIETPVNPNKRPAIDFDDAFDDSLLFSDDLNPESEDFNDEVNELINSKLKTPALEENNNEEIPDIPITSEEPQTNEPLRQSQTNEVVPSPGFFKARVAEELQKNPNAATSETFNTQFISPSIRRTVDPTKSAPIKRTSDPKTIRYDNPRLIPNRQVGKPRYPLPKRLRSDNEGESVPASEK